MNTARFPFVEFYQLQSGSPEQLDKEVISTTEFTQELEQQPVVAEELFFTEKDLEEAKLQVFEEGKKEGIEKQRQMDESFKETIMDALHQVMRRVDDINFQLSSQQEIILDGLTDLAYSLACKISETGKIEMMEETVLKFIQDNIKLFIEEPSLNIKLSPEVYLKAQEAIEKAFAGHKFNGKLLFSIDNSLSLSDCIVEFQNTTITKSRGELLEAINSILVKYLSKGEDNIESVGL